jgi:uncharacterized caspase-like protein
MHVNTELQFEKRIGERRSAVMSVKRVSVASVLVLLAMPVARSQGTANAPAATGNTWALVVGIGNYKNPEIPKLQFTADDARLFYGYLTSPEGLAVRPERAVILLDEQATVANIRSALGDFIAKKAQPQDTVVFFFAGHGGNELDLLTGSRPETAKFLVAYDTEPDRYYGTALNMKDDLGYVFEKRIAAQSALFFLDCCYAGAAGQASARSMQGRGILKTQAMGIAVTPSTPVADVEAGDKKTLIAMACRPDESALETATLKHGVFTAASVEALNGAADADGDGVVSAGEYKTSAEALVVKLSQGAQHPQFTSSLPAAYRLSNARKGAAAFQIASNPVSSPLWQAGTGASAPSPANTIVVEQEYVTQIKRDKDSLLLATVSVPGKSANIREALDDARQQQRRLIRQQLGLGADEAESVYGRGEVVDAQELPNRTWYLVMKYALS